MVKGDFILGLSISSISVTAIIIATGFPESISSEIPGAAFFPTIVGSLLIALSCALMYKGIKEKKQYFNFKKDKKNLLICLITMLLSLTFTLFIGKVHFVPLCAIYICSLGILYKQKLIKIIPMSLISSVIIYYIFNKLLNVMLNS